MRGTQLTICEYLPCYNFYLPYPPIVLDACLGISQSDKTQDVSEALPQMLANACVPISQGGSCPLWDALSLGVLGHGSGPFSKVVSLLLLLLLLCSFRAPGWMVLLATYSALLTCLLTTYPLLLTTYHLLLNTYLPLTTYYYHLLLNAYYLLPTTYCLLPTTCYLQRTGYYLLLTTYCMLLTTYYLTPIAYYLLITTYFIFVGLGRIGWWTMDG